MSQSTTSGGNAAPAPQGVPSWALAGEVIPVQVGHIRLLGTQGALVRALIGQRLGQDGEQVHYSRGLYWWRGSLKSIAEDTGLSPDQVNRTVRRLLKSGYLEARKLEVNDNLDHTLSYRLSSPVGAL